MVEEEGFLKKKKEVSCQAEYSLQQYGKQRRWFSYQSHSIHRVDPVQSENNITEAKRDPTCVALLFLWPGPDRQRKGRDWLCSWLQRTLAHGPLVLCVGLSPWGEELRWMKVVHFLASQEARKEDTVSCWLFFFSLPHFIISGHGPSTFRVCLPHSPREAFTDAFRDVLTDTADSYLAKLTQMANHHTFIYVARWMQPVAWECSGSAFTGPH